MPRLFPTSFDQQIIAAKPRTRRGRGPRSGGAGGAGGAGAGAGGARARYAGAAPKSASAKQSARAAAPVPAKPITADAQKIIISNLPADVTDAAVRDLMQSTVGPVRSVHLSYTSTGKSTGVATVMFKNKGDANKAHSTYHNRMIDNR